MLSKSSNSDMVIGSRICEGRKVGFIDVIEGVLDSIDRIHQGTECCQCN